MCYVITLMGDHLSALLMSLMALRLTLVDRNPFRPCLCTYVYYYFEYITLNYFYTQDIYLWGERLPNLVTYPPVTCTVF